MDAGTLYDEIAVVSPVASTVVGKSDDRSTWTWVPGSGATTAQIAAGDNVIATLPIEQKIAVPIGDFIARWTNAEYLALEKKRRDDIADNKIGNAKNWDDVMSDHAIDMKKKKVQTLKTDLVTDGILTQSRADEIFS